MAIGINIEGGEWDGQDIIVTECNVRILQWCNNRILFLLGIVFLSTFLTTQSAQSKKQLFLVWKDLTLNSIRDGIKHVKGCVYVSIAH